MDDKCHVPLFVKNVSVEPPKDLEVITLHVTGMGCVNCANRVHNRLIDHPAVVEAVVNHTTGEAVVTFLPGQITVSALLILVAESGDYRHTYRAMLQLV
jgi:copper chaperone CopZ